MNLARALIIALLAALGLPAAAVAHGRPADPVASSYLAQVRATPHGVSAEVLGADQRLRLSVASGPDVLVLDYQGLPYLRFSAAGVEVNRHSAMYYLNLPTPVDPPSTLGARAPAEWAQVTAAHSYAWHDGRLHALATVALSPGQRFVGQWTIPLVVAGRRTAITGALFHAPRPPIIWFWPPVVIVLCVVAAWRLRQPGLDAWLNRGLTACVLGALGLATAGRELYGRPTVTAGQLVLLGAVLAFAVWGVVWLALDRLRFLALLLIGAAALGGAIVFLPTLWNGYVFTTLPADLIRAATVICLGGGLSVLLVGFRASEGRPDPDARRAHDPMESSSTHFVEPAS